LRRFLVFRNGVIVCDNCGFTKERHVAVPSGKLMCVRVPKQYYEEKPVSNHLTGKVTDELVERCFIKYKTLIGARGGRLTVDENTQVAIRTVLEEAVREPVVLCKNCKQCVYYVRGVWSHSPSGAGFMRCTMMAEPEDG
jgi:hypothetical protein